MGSGVTLWGRNRHQESMDAMRFLKAHGYGADRLLDLARQPPSREEWLAIRKGLGGSLRGAVDLRASGVGEVFAAGVEGAGEDEVLAALVGDPGLARCPILLTPKGALCGFRERAWGRFLELGKVSG